MTDVMLWGAVIGELAEGLTRILETAGKMQRGEAVTKADLAAARKRTDEAMDRLTQAVEARDND